MSVALDRDARLGEPTALHVEMTIDPVLAPSPVTEMRLTYPQSLGVTTSGLGLAACRRSPHDFTQVVIWGTGLAGCSPNAVMARGRARAEVRLGGTEVVPEEAAVTMLSGPIERGRLELVAFVDGIRPLGGKLAFRGEVLPGRVAGDGGTLRIVVPPTIPDYDDVVVALLRLQLSIGGSDIVYYERVGGRRVAYRPEGIVLPDRCPRGGFPFRVRLTHLDGSVTAASTRAGCPRRAAAR